MALTRAGWFRFVTRWGIHLAIASVLLGLVIWRSQLWRLDELYADFDPWLAVGAALMNVPIMLLVALRGKFILARLQYSVPVFALLPIAILGNVLGSLTPASSGDLVRTPFFKERHDIAYPEGVATVLFERASSLYFLTLTTGVAAAWSTLPAGYAGLISAALAAVLVATPGIAIAVLQRLRPWLPSDTTSTPRISRAPTIIQRLLAVLGRSFDSLVALLRDGWGLVGIALFNIAIFGAMAAQMWLTVRALGPELSPSEAWMVLGTSMLAGISTFLPLGIGTLDATLAAVIGVTERDFAVGAAAALLRRLTATLPLGLAAFGSYLFLVSGRRHRAAQDALDVPVQGDVAAQDGAGR